MRRDLARHHRRSIRLRSYDYTQAGAYFITICARNRACIFADVRASEAVLTPIGEVVASCWDVIPNHFPSAELDAFVVMPNHVHGIVVLGDRRVGAEGTACRALLADRLGPLPPGRIPSLWQSNYHEHIVRYEGSLNHPRDYIATNPSRWLHDSLHPDHPERAHAR